MTLLDRSMNILVSLLVYNIMCYYAVSDGIYTAMGQNVAIVLYSPYNIRVPTKKCDLHTSHAIIGFEFSLGSS